MKALVTGGSGFIGTNLIIRLIQLGYEVVSVDIKAPRWSEHLALYKYCDIRDYEALKDVFSKFQPDEVYHLAARTDLDGRSLDDYSSNIEGVDVLCRVLACSSVKKLIFASSMLVCKPGYQPRDNFDYLPSTVYGESKVFSERIVRERQNSLPPFVIVRPTSIWGPWFDIPYRNFFDVVLSGRFFHPAGRACTKTYGYVENCVNQIISLPCDQNSGEVYYLGDQPPLNISMWANQIAHLAGLSKPKKVPFLFYQLLAYLGDFLSIFKIKFPMTTFRLRNMTTDCCIDCSKAVSHNLYEIVGLDEGVIRTLHWLSSEK